MTPSAYMRRNTRGILKNPPLSAFGSRSAKRRPARTQAGRSKTKPASSPRIAATRLGTPVEIVYRHVHGGTYRHRFTKGAQLVHTNDGAALIITGVNVKAFIEG